MNKKLATKVSIPSLSLIALAISSAAVADEKASTFFEITARVQSELVNVDGSAAEARNTDKWYITDGWGNGTNNSHNWSAVFLDGEHKFTNGVRLFVRHSYNFNMDGLNDGRAKYRESYVGVAGDFGMVRGGRLESPYKLNTLQWDPFVGSFLQARANGGKSGGPLGAGGYIDDAVDYTLVQNGITFRALYSNNDGQPAPSGVERDTMWAGSVNVPVGNVELALAHFDAGNRDDGKRDGTKIGARTSLDQFTFAAEYEFRGTGLENADILFFSTTYNAERRSYSLSYGEFMDNGIMNNDGEYFALGFKQTINPRVMFHGGYRQTRRDLTGTEHLIGVGVRLIWRHRSDF